MKSLIYSFFIALTIVACNNGEVKKQQPTLDNSVASKADNAKLASFPGTSIYIPLPQGFTWSETAMGFYKEEDGSVIKYDEFKKMRHAANMPVEEVVGTLINQQQITINGYKGEVKTYRDASTGTKLELSFGDNTFMEFIEASYFSHREQTEKDILMALKNIQVKKR